MEPIHIFYNELEIDGNDVLQRIFNKKMKLKMYYLKK